MPEHLVIERFEDDLARVEWGEKFLDLPRSWLPKKAKAGDHLRIDTSRDGQVTFTLDREGTQRAQQANQEALNALNDGDSGGTLTL